MTKPCIAAGSGQSRFFLRQARPTCSFLQCSPPDVAVSGFLLTTLQYTIFLLFFFIIRIKHAVITRAICRVADLYGTESLLVTFFNSDTVAISYPLHVLYHTEYPEQGESWRLLADLPHRMGTGTCMTMSKGKVLREIHPLQSPITISSWARMALKHCAGRRESVP